MFLHFYVMFYINKMHNYIKNNSNLLIHIILDEQQETSTTYRKKTEKTMKLYEPKKKLSTPPKQKLSSTVAPIQSPSSLFEEISPIKVTAIDPVIKNDLELIMKKPAYTPEEKFVYF